MEKSVNVWVTEWKKV